MGELWKLVRGELLGVKSGESYRLPRPPMRVANAVCSARLRSECTSVEVWTLMATPHRGDGKLVGRGQQDEDEEEVGRMVVLSVVPMGRGIVGLKVL